AGSDLFFQCVSGQIISHYFWVSGFCACRCSCCTFAVVCRQSKSEKLYSLELRSQSAGEQLSINNSVCYCIHRVAGEFQNDQTFNWEYTRHPICTEFRR